MAHKSSSSSESFTSGSSSAHEKDDDDSDETTKKKTKTATSAALAGIATEKALKREAQERKSRSESFWRKITGEGDGPKDAKKPETPLFGIQRPEDDSLVRPDKNDAQPISTETSLADGDSGVVFATERETTVDTPAEDIALDTDTEQSRAEVAELKQSARDFAEVRLAAADGQLHELPLDQQSTPEAAEVAADVALLRTMHDQLGEDSAQSAGEALDAAEQTVAEHIRDFPTPAVAAETAADDRDTRTPDAVGAAEQSQLSVDDILNEDLEAMGGEFVESAEAAASGEVDPTEEIEPLTPIPMSNGAETAASYPPLPPVSPVYSGRGGSHLPPNGPYGPGGPSFGPGGPAAFPSFTGGLPPRAADHEAAAHNTYSSSDMAHAERAGAGRGLLVGGLVGYFFGRRRGKRLGRAESEKRSKPVRRGLEKQVENLQYSITAKEQKIKTMAREKMRTVLGTADRRRFVENMAQPVAKANVTREVSPSILSPKQTAEAVSTEQPSRHPERIVAQAAVMQNIEAANRTAALTAPEAMSAAAQLYSRESLSTALPAVELLIHDRYRQESERSTVIPFNKKAEQFTDEELKATAEKIKVHGVSLKEMVQLGSLDERSLRIVVAEFLEGGDVSAAVSREIKEKELKYERDPRMRQSAGSGQQAGSGVNGGGGGGSGVTVGAMAGGDAYATDEAGGSSSARVSQSGLANNTSTAYTGPRPTPDAATLKSIRDKQIATVAGMTLLVVLVVTALIFVTR